MKKLTAVLLVLALVMPLVFANAASEQPAAASSNSSVFDDVKPLDQKVKLVISTHAGTHHGFLVYLIEKFGGYEKAGIDAEIITFAGGPVQMEALTSNAWDVGTTGIGGVLNGVLRNNLVVIAPIGMDNASIRIWAKNDTDIVKTGPTTASNVYGTAAQWKGQEVIATTGTTLHYTLGLGLQELGLSLDDVKITHMDVASANTALLAGKGDIGGVWGTYSYGEALNAQYTTVMNATDLKSNISVTLVANPNAYADPVKKEAIAKFTELIFKAIDWVYANLDEAAELFTEVNEESGVVSTVEANMTTLTHDKFYTLEEAYHMHHDMTKDGYTPLYEGHRGPLAFYATKIGNYSASDLANFKPANFKSEIVDALYLGK